MRLSLAALACVLSCTLAPSARAGEDEACHHPEAAPAQAKAKGQASDGWVLTRGAKLQGAPAVPALSLAKLLEDPAPHDGQTLRVDGTVRRACSRKGCWMELASDAKGPGVRVTFKDYGFFVPVDSAGAQARVVGVVKVAELSEATARHYASEGAIVPRGQDGKAREVQLIASGVELRR